MEVLDEIHVDGTVGEVAEHGEAQLAIQDDKVVAVADILAEAAHVGGEGLISIVLRVVDGCALVERGQNPIVNAPHVIDELLLSKRTASRDAVGPDEITADAGVMSVIESDNDHVVGVTGDALPKTATVLPLKKLPSQVAQ